MEKTTNVKTIYQGKILDLIVKDIVLENGIEAKREIIKHKKGVGIVAVDKSYVYLVKQFRSAIEQEIYEIPAGLIEDGEDALETANRELQEEIGFKAGHLELLTSFYPSPGFCDEITYVAYATDLVPSKKELDIDENLEVIKLPIENIDNFIASQKVIDAKTILGLTLLKNKIR